MKRNFLLMAKTGGFAKHLFIGLTLVFAYFLLVGGAFAQTRKTTAPKTPPKTAPLNLPKVMQIDGVMLSSLLKREGDAAKPLLVNFWATWCVPCVEEFPDLVELDKDFRGKVEIITVSLDDLADIETAVPKFLAEMKAEMPAYLLRTEDEEGAISSVSKEWSGALPFTILLSGKGETAYSKQGKFKPDVLRAELEKVIKTETVTINTEAQDVNSKITLREVVRIPMSDHRFTYERGKTTLKETLPAND